MDFWSDIKDNISLFERELLRTTSRDLKDTSRLFFCVFFSLFIKKCRTTKPVNELGHMRLMLTEAQSKQKAAREKNQVQFHMIKACLIICFSGPSKVYR